MARTRPAWMNLGERIVSAAGILGAVCLAVLLLLMLAELVSRNMLNRSLHITWEISSYLMSAVVFLTAGSALQHDVHVRVSALFELIGPRAGRLLDAAVTLVGFAVAAWIAYFVGVLAYTSFSNNTMSWSGFGIPLYLPQTASALGAAIFALQLILRFARIVGGYAPAASHETPAGGL
ncbi:TRAP transporter small permease subunit [Pseudohoeflea coraliihabitans]|uniref:TRAP transporter small permease protein n=1 Tax=Pseudohoeflea coraliihabitans TaxID=2860393 RepID=A0ABS6WMJ8_9HYPH|nr:TRAP transporter small permease [Pseudohoeflea sp. DP4N28-3]MBW3097171.1 TRAP transporter small permease [Pseudohoeflea sp. DP4N28-3]